ncbi:16S rRNA (cytosine(967)-C(5))-methyltransferase RsmB [Roseibium aestuarii]|uniref:16S rRNA (cytosine(967)-C(5))-methyltransferase n=1 Tax=Roseibium aestuarii TaxID=2600299 RepID=A0ABW4K2C3_9HYPH
MARPTGGTRRPQTRPQQPKASQGDDLPGLAGKPGFAARKVAADILGNVVHKRHAIDAELDLTSGHSGFRALAPNDRALVRAIVGGSLRHRGEIAAILDRLLDRKIPEKTGRVVDILHIAITQMLYLDIPDSAAVNLAVDHAGADRRAKPYKGLVNGVLRRLGRERDEMTADLDGVRLNTPDWLFESWTETYGAETARAIAEAHSKEAAVDLSIKDDAAGWATRVGGTLVGNRSVRLGEKAIIDQLDGYAEGAWWVQDAAAALPARLLGDIAGKSVADLCAAPGGKTLQLAAAGAKVTAVDISRSRLKRVSDNLARTGMTAEIVAADLKTWEPKAPFDAILLDAPCGATGTIRRHPDLPWIKQAYDIGKLAEIQTELLDRALTWLKPGGLLVYCTCSLQPEEGEAQIAALLERNPAVSLEPVTAEDLGGLTTSISPEGYLRSLPHHPATADGSLTGLDGFFAARLRKN